MKPDCNCVERIIQELQLEWKDATMVYFPDMNLFSGTLTNKIISEKDGKKLRKFQRTIVHNYCPFCGKKHLEINL